MHLRKGQEVELEIDSIAFGGAGIGRYEGMAVFVAGVMPGDKVIASFTRIKAKFAEADLVKIIQPSPERVQPRCKYFGTCGGCQLQFMPYEKQLEMKRQQVIDSFERIGGISGVAVAEVIGSEKEYFYRNKMEFSFGYDAEMNFTLGMHLPGRRYDILDLEQCYLQSEFSVRIVNAVREVLKKLKWPPFKFSCGEGFLKGLFIREGKRTGEVMVILKSSDDLPANFDAGMQQLLDVLLSLDGGTQKIVSIYHLQTTARQGIPTKITETLLHGKEVLEEHMLLEDGSALKFDILPQAFFQVNTLQAEILYSQVLKFALEDEHQIVFDLFCGTGTIGLFLADKVDKVIGIELNESALKIAGENAKKNGIENIEFLQGDAGEMLRNLKEKPSLIVVDPPRAGLSKKLIEQLAGFECERIVYVSCNPSTLARDCQELENYGYAVSRVQPVDMFPHTFHIENVCLLER